MELKSGQLKDNNDVFTICFGICSVKGEMLNQNTESLPVARIVIVTKLYGYCHSLE
jgi:hypothetical protein